MQFAAWTVLLIVLAAGCGSDPASDVAAVTPQPTVMPVPSVTPVPTLMPTPVPQPEPTSTPTVNPVPSAEPVRMRIDYGSEPDQFGWLQLPAVEEPADGHPVVVLIHGGFWRQQFDLSLMNALADDLADRGYASWNIEYRRVDGAGGWPETGDDVAAAIEYLATVAREHPIDLDRAVSVGHSAGGHLGLWALGQHQQVQLRGSIGLGAVVDLAYFGQARGLLGGEVDDVPQVYSDAAPVLDPGRIVLIQGSADTIVPAASLRVAEEAQVPIVVIDGDDHFDLIDPSSASWAATVEALVGLMASPG